MTDQRWGVPVEHDSGHLARRREARYLASVDRLWMQWWAVGEHNGRPALLVNVSRHGAMIVSPVLFEPGQVVRIFLEDAPTPLGVQGVVRGATEGVNGRHQVRLSFATACPDEFFEAAAHGFEAWLTGRGTHQGLS